MEVYGCPKRDLNPRSNLAQPAYVGRFAPSPTGPLHLGSLVAAIASYDDARSHGGTWLVRMEDLDPPRESPGAAQSILVALQAHGLVSDRPVLFQSTRHAAYQAAFERLRALGLVYPCSCTRREIADSVSHEKAQSMGISAQAGTHELVYPGTCRDGLLSGRSARAWRLRVPLGQVEFTDRVLGTVRQSVAEQVGDFVLKRADGPWAYQLAVVVDDAWQGVTDVVRGDDLLHSTARQVVLQQLLGLPTPRYWHVPVVRAADGEKLSKQNGATALNLQEPTANLAWARQWVAKGPVSLP
jgi:glutamyl-Q tRNA(Asp) synthetase